MSSIQWFDASDPGVVSQWETLAESLQAGPFMRPGWFTAWTEAFGGDGSVHAVLGDSSLRALVPLVRTSRSPRCPVNEHSPEFTLLADGEAGAIELVSHLLAEKPTSLELFKVPPETRDAAQAAGDRTGYRVVASIMERSPYLELSGPWEDYEKSLSANFRQSLRRKNRRLQDEGNVSIETQDGRRDLDAALDEGFAVESSQWKAEEGTAIASDARVQGFYTAVARWAAERDWLRLVFLRLDGAPIAFRFDLVADGGYYHLKGGYDPAYGRFSPGLILQHETVREAFDQGLARYEFLGADEPYKLKWTSTCRDRHAVRCFAPTVAGRLAWGRRAWLGPLARRMKSVSK